MAKAAGSYRLPWGLLGSANFQHVSGQPYARQVLFTGGKQIPSIVLNVEPLGSRRMPHMNQLDVRVEKTLRLYRGRLAVRVEVFNVLNSNTVLGLTTRSGSAFERPTSIMPPRIGMLSMEYGF